MKQSFPDGKSTKYSHAKMQNRIYIFLNKSVQHCKLNKAIISKYKCLQKIKSVIRYKCSTSKFVKKNHSG